MKITWLILLTLSCLLSFSAISPQKAESNDQSYAVIAEKALIPYFDALKSGDVITIKKHIAGKMLQRYRVLLDENKKYSDFLRNYYQGVEFSIAAVQLVGDDILATAMIMFPGNKAVSSSYLLRKDNHDGSGSGMPNERWKIVRQIEE